VTFLSRMVSALLDDNRLADGRLLGNAPWLPLYFLIAAVAPGGAAAQLAAKPYAVTGGCRHQRAGIGKMAKDISGRRVAYAGRHRLEGGLGMHLEDVRCRAVEEKRDIR